MSEVLETPETTDDDIEIVHTDVDPPEGVTQTPETPAGPTPEEAAETLRAQLAAEQAMNARIKTERDQAQSEGLRFKNEAQSAQYNAISTRLDAETNALAGAKKSYKTAMENGDYDAAADAQEAISTHTGNKNQLAAGKAEMERVIKAAPVVQPKDEFETRVSGFSTPTQQWLRAHPDAVNDPEKAAYVMAAHHKAVRAGKSPDSPEYFDFIEQDVGYKPRPTAAAAQPARPVNLSAPAGATARHPGGKPINGAPFRMTPRMREAAANSGVTEQAYAKEVQRGLKNGEPWAIDLTASVN